MGYSISNTVSFTEYQIGQSQAAARSLQQQPRHPTQSKDDAYAEFMKEMSGLM